MRQGDSRGSRVSWPGTSAFKDGMAGGRVCWGESRLTAAAGMAGP